MLSGMCWSVILLWRDTMMTANIYKRKHFIGACLKFWEFSPFLSWRTAWRLTGRQWWWRSGVLHLDLQTVVRAFVLRMGLLKPQSQSHTSSNKATVHSFQIVPPSGDHVLKSSRLWGPSHLNHHSGHDISDREWVRNVYMVGKNLSYI